MESIEKPKCSRKFSDSLESLLHKINRPLKLDQWLSTLDAEVFLQLREHAGDFLKNGTRSLKCFDIIECVVIACEAEGLGDINEMSEARFARSLHVFCLHVLAESLVRDGWLEPPEYQSLDPSVPIVFKIIGEGELREGALDKYRNFR